MSTVSQELQADFNGIPVPDFFNIINSRQVHNLVDELKILKENHLALQKYQEHRSEAENRADMVWNELKAAYEEIAAGWI